MCIYSSVQPECAQKSVYLLQMWFVGAASVQKSVSPKGEKCVYMCVFDGATCVCTSYGVVLECEPSAALSTLLSVKIG